MAQNTRAAQVHDAEEAAAGAEMEEGARRRYHDAEEEARHRYGRNGSKP